MGKGKESFEHGTDESDITREKAMQAFILLRAQAEKNFPNGMSLNEINEEIYRVRYEKVSDILNPKV